MRRREVMRWFSNPVLLEWDESIPWSDAERQTSYEALLQLTRRLAFRTVPLGAVLFATGFWLIGRIPRGGGPIPYRTQLIFAGPWLLFWLLPYVALRLGLAKPKRGTYVHVRFHLRGIQFIDVSGNIKGIDWSRFDTFVIGRWNGFDVLKLRFRDNWLLRRTGPKSVTAVEFGTAQVNPYSIREVLQDRGLYEETLDEPLANR